MATPVFEEFDPASDCDCPGCVQRRRVSAYASATMPAGPAVPRPLVVATATVAVAAVGAGNAIPSSAASHAPARLGVPAGDGRDTPDTPQGGKAPLHGPSGRPARPTGVARTPATTRAEIIRRAERWVSAGVPYSMTAYWSDGYRQDCSGFVSMAWNLPGNEWTGTLDTFGTPISREELQPGDILLFHNPADPRNGSHVVLFGGWTDYARTSYLAYEQTRPTARRQATPYAYWTHSDGYVAYRYKGLTPDPVTTLPETGGSAAPPAPTASATPTSTPYPGPSAFGPGADNAYVTELGRLLVARGGARFYASGPGPRWSEADRRATEAFQRAQGWRGAAADGLPGPRTWHLLVTGTGNGIPPADRVRPTRIIGAGFPGRGMFRPGAVNAHVTRLGTRLAEKGFGRFYTQGPGARWGDADRRAVEAFQRAQGWRGTAADGYPGPETWRRLFS